MIVRRHLLATLALAVAANSCASGPAPVGARQVPVEDFELPETGAPRFAPSTGPRVSVDAAHFNFHTIDNRYRAFAGLLRRDGYNVDSFSEPFDATTLATTDLLVISNALTEQGRFDWSLPDDSAFTTAEIDALAAWVAEGGSLLLIADHMPLPGHAAELAAAFGALFHDGFAYDADGASRLTFSADNGLLGAHATTTLGAHPVPFVMTFTGQAFRMRPGVEAQPLLTLPQGAYMLLPSVAWEFDERTPRIPADGLLQGAVLEHGRGRVAIFGEAAAFSAQVQISAEGDRTYMGMSHPEATHNARFLLNVIEWLLPDA